MGQEYIVTYWWTPPVPPGYQTKEEAAFQLRQLRLPCVGQVVTWELPHPMTVGQTAPSIIALGRVTAVTAVKQQPGLYVVHLERCLGGLDYEELCACVHVPCVGFHPDFGCVEGRLVGLDPHSDLAGIADPLFTPYLQEDDAPEDEPEEAVIWVDWATVWPRATVSLPPIAEPQRERPVPPQSPPDASATIQTAGTLDLPEEARRLVLELVREHRQRHYHSLSTPFLWNDKPVLLAVLPSIAAAQDMGQVLRTMPIAFQFDYEDFFSPRHDYDEVEGKIIDTKTWDIPGMSHTYLAFTFRVQQTSPLTYAFAGTLSSLARLVGQTTLPVLLFGLDEQQRHLYVGTVELPFPAAAQSAARDAMRQAQDYAQKRRHTAAEWSQTAAVQLLQQLGSDREALRLQAVIRQAYLRGLLLQGSIEELVAVVIGHSQPEEDYFAHIEGLGPQRLAQLRTLLEQHPAAAALLQEQLPLSPVSTTAWEQTEAGQLLSAHGALGGNAVLTYIYHAGEILFRRGEIVGSRTELEEIASGQRRVPGIGQKGMDQLATLLGVAPGRHLMPPLVPFGVHPKQVQCEGHGTVGGVASSWADDDAPPATLLTITERGDFAFCCAECYPERQEYGWRYVGRPQEIVAESGDGFVHGSRPYEDVYVPLAGEAAGKCFSVDKRFWRSDPPTAICVVEHTRRLRNPAIIARREHVAALVAALPQTPAESTLGKDAEDPSLEE